ncbi:hypothetical protein BY458DRAFT_529622 [Sporodiniella umbellata]|nr:hypothetical protein BY458DRAFT_529622 [Sporodiniella umbellata]
MDIARQLVQEGSLASLIAVHLFLSLLSSVTINPSYNVPIFFFGIWAYNYRESTSPLKTFTGALGLSVVLDVVWLIARPALQESLSGFVTFMSIISLILKPVTLFAATRQLQERGDVLSAGNWTEAPGAFPGGYQNVRDGNAEEFA